MKKWSEMNRWQKAEDMFGLSFSFRGIARFVLMALLSGTAGYLWSNGEMLRGTWYLAVSTLIWTVLGPPRKTE